jgi:superfamily II DNA or RNA helicase
MIAPLCAPVRARIEIPKAGTTREQREALRAGLRFADPSEPTAPKLTTLVETADTLFVPRGKTGLVRSTFRGIHLRDERFVTPPVDFKLDASVVPRAYQIEAAQAAFDLEQCAVVMGMGAGKTTTQAELAVRCRQRTLITEPTADLVTQTASAMQRMLGVTPGIIAGGRCELTDLSVCTWQSLQSPETLARCVAHFGAIFVDEMHFAGAPVVFGIVDAFPARYRVGFTATLRDDSLQARVDALFGRVGYRLDVDALERGGHTMPVRRAEVRSKFFYEVNDPIEDYGPMCEALVNDKARNALIADVVCRECCGGRTGLALTGRVQHALDLRDILVGRGLRALAIVGTMRKAERLAALDAARRGEVDVLVCTQLADVGLDAPILSRLVLCFPGKAEGRFLQRVGRIIRPHAAKGDCLVVDIVDAQVGILRHQARIRAQIFAKTWPAPRQLDARRCA